MKINASDHFDFLVNNINHLAENIQPLWHPLGFVSCVIQEVKSEYTLRVHFWPSNERRTKNPDWPIHTHSYALSSLILSGEIQDIQYNTTDGHEYSIYKVEYSQGNSEIIKTDKTACLTETVNLIQPAGNEYRVERGTFHQSRVKFDHSAVTLVALSDASSEPPLVLGRTGDFRYPYDRIPFDKELFWASVRHSISTSDTEHFAATTTNV